MKNSEILELSTKELEESLVEERANLNTLRINHAISPLENPLKIKYSRKKIARILTELNKRNDE